MYCLSSGLSSQNVQRSGGMRVQKRQHCLLFTEGYILQIEFSCGDRKHQLHQIEEIDTC